MLLLACHRLEYTPFISSEHPDQGARSRKRTHPCRLVPITTTMTLPPVPSDTPWCIVLPRQEDALMVQAVSPQTAPELIDAPEDCALAVWQERYPDRWLLVEVTHEDDGEPLTGRLLAPAVASSLGRRLVGTERIIGVTGRSIRRGILSLPTKCPK